MEQLYRVPDVAKKLSVSRRTLDRWIADGKIKAVRINGLPRITESELKKFIKEE